MSNTLDKRRSDARREAGRYTDNETEIGPGGIRLWVGRHPEILLTYGAALLLVDTLLAAIGKYEIDHLGDAE